MPESKPVPWEFYAHLRSEKARLEREILPHLPRDLVKRTHAIMALDLVDQLTKGGPFEDGRVLFSRFDLAAFGEPVEDCFVPRDFGRKLSPDEAVDEAWKWCPLKPQQSRSAFLRWLKGWRRTLAEQGCRVPYAGPLPQEDRE